MFTITYCHERRTLRHVLTRRVISSHSFCKPEVNISAFVLPSSMHFSHPIEELFLQSGASPQQQHLKGTDRFMHHSNLNKAHNVYKVYLKTKQFCPSIPLGCRVWGTYCSCGNSAFSRLLVTDSSILSLYAFSSSFPPPPPHEIGWMMCALLTTQSFLGQCFH
jgi:hypothetical protein